jgi:aminomethyltransferase
MLKRTPLYELHQQSGAKLVDFAGWEMPLHYGSQIEEHHYVRQHAGIFDVSHMNVVDVEGNDAKAFLRYLLANDVAKLQQGGQALYTCMLNEQGGVIDDLIVYLCGENNYRLVLNAGTREKDLAWIQQHAKSFAVQLKPRPELAILAIQGPQAIQLILAALPPELSNTVAQLKPFEFIRQDEWFIARTGYTGEDGLEIILPAVQAKILWQAAISNGIHPVGLGARDTLRLEAGLNLYGADMDENVTPLESNLAWTIAWEPSERNFIGRSALTTLKEQGVQQKLIGLVLNERGVLRNHQQVLFGDKIVGEITSGSFSPTLNCAIAFARIPVGNETNCNIDIRGKLVSASIVKPTFIRRGKKLI